MRNENYFEVKLASAKETLTMAERKLEHLDIQMQKLKERFDHDKKVYDDQAKHMQEIISEMKKRIPQLEKKLEQGYSHFDVKTGKAYKSFDEIHEGRLRDKIDETKRLEEEFQAEHERRKKLMTKKRPSEEDLEIIEAERIRESLQPKEEIDEAKQKQIELLQEKRAFYQARLAELEKKAPHDEAPIDKIIEEKNEIAEEFRRVADEMNGESRQLKTVVDSCMDWIDEYADTEGGHAIWQGRITNGFRTWCESKGYKLPE